MKTKKVLCMFLITLFASTLYPKTSLAVQTTNNATNEPQFRVVGYYSGDLFDIPVEKLQTDKLTHVFYAFLIPQEDGSLVDLEKPEKLKQLVAQAHNDGAKVFIALGGWSYQNKPLAPVFEAVAADEEKRRRLIDNICAFTEEYKLDGVELDWEHPTADTIADYERLAAELKTVLYLQGRELTAALNGAWSPSEGPEVNKLITDNCLKNFDFINVMAYDMNNEAHSPIWFAETSIEYWLNRGVPARNIVLGMPLYAKPSWMQYRHLVAQNPEYAYSDYAATTPLESHYNSINTLREKTVIAMNKAGGVMLFDVNEDTEDETSIVSMINDLLSRTGHLSKEQLQKHITVIIDKRELVFRAEEGAGVPFIDENNRTMIPVRKPLEAIGATVNYDADNHTVTVVKDGTTVGITIGENHITINGYEFNMDTQAVLRDNRVYLPLRQIFTAFGYNIEWHSNSNTIILNKPESLAVSVAIHS